LNGGDGNDTLVGGAGVDTITGGSGSDTFRYTSTGDSSTTLSDIIKDFDATDDSEDIFLDGLLLGTFSFLGSEAIGFTSTSNTEARFNDSSNLLEIDTDGNGTADMEMTLNGVALTDLDINDFTVTV
jgi:Ca2+-binding RTX toxin-like protein